MISSDPQNVFPESLDAYQFQPEGGRAAFYFFDYLLIKQYSVENPDLPLGDINTVSAYTNLQAKWFRIHKDSSEYAKALEGFVCQPRLADRLLGYLKKQRQTTINLLRRDYQKMSDEGLREFLDLLVSCFYRLLRPSSVIRLVDLGIIAELKKASETFGWTAEIPALLSANGSLSFALQEEKEMLNLAIKMNKKRLTVEQRSVLSSLSNIQERFCHSELGYYNEPIKTLDDYRRKLLSVAAMDPEKRLKEINQNQKETREKRKRFFKKLDKRLKTLSQLAAKMAFVKDHYKFFMNQAIYFCEPVFFELAKRTGQSVDGLKDLSPEEIKDLLLQKSLDEQGVTERISQHVLITFQKVFYVLTGVEARDFRTKFLTHENKTGDLKGRCASLGRATGKVKVILNPKDFSKMEAGNILVVMNTSPDFLCILKKAAAIVAEEGGLTSHVSIISREMCVPAVVGVARATDVLKDGDLVEVDAEKGIIKILEPASS